MQRITGLEAEIADLKGGAKALETDLAEANTALAAVANEKKAAEEENQQQTQALQDKIVDLEAHVEAGDGSRQADAETSADVVRLERELVEAKVRASELEKATAEAQDQVSKLLGVNADLTTQLAVQAQAAKQHTAKGDEVAVEAKLARVPPAVATKPTDAPVPSPTKKAVPPPVVAKKSPPKPMPKKVPPVPAPKAQSPAKKTPPPVSSKKPKGPVASQAADADEQADGTPEARQTELDRIVEERRLFQLASKPHIIISCPLSKWCPTIAI